jgi:membrane-associated protein
MELIRYLIDLFLHLDEYLSVTIQTYGTWTYALLFLVIFVETGFVVTPFLPGDSLLFAAGTFASPALGSPLSIGLLDRTHAFFERHGGKTIIIARFVPIIRTFAPFVAGVGEMSYGRFISYNIVGGVAWVTLFTFGGYFFGNLPFVKDNFSFVVLAIILISVMPAVIEVIKERMHPAKKAEV